MSSGIAIPVEPVSAHDAVLGSGEHGTLQCGGDVERWLGDHTNLFALAVTAAGLVARLYVAAASYLNPDEAIHYLLLNQPTVTLAYKASLTNAHPPLIYLLVYFLRFLGRSELMLRLPSVFAGAALCWVAYKWISLMFGKAAGIIGLVLISFSPAFIALSAELRSYALLMFFETAALYFGEAALREKSVRKMWYSSVFLYLAILSHYSALFFAVAAGVYGLARLAESGAPRKVILAWGLGQAGGVSIFAVLYVTHVAKIKNSISIWALPFDQGYFHSDSDTLLNFARIRTMEVFSYLFENQYTAAALFLAWTITVALLLYRDYKPPQDRAGTRFSGILLLLPFIAAWAAAIAGVYPYVGDRHTAYLAPFVIAAVSYLLATMFGQKLWAGVVIAVLLATASISSGKMFEPYITRENQSQALMLAAANYMHQSIPQTDLILTDLQSSVAISYYFCGPKAMFTVTMRDTDQYHLNFSCDGYSILSFRQWKFFAGNFTTQFQNMARQRGLKPGDRVWYFQYGWGTNLDRQLPFGRPAFRCMVTQRFGGNISVMPFNVGPDLLPVATVTNCPAPAFNSFAM